MGKYQDTPQYMETQAVVAAMQGDDEELERLLREMMRNERRNLRDACLMVSAACEMMNRGSNRL